MTRPAGKMADTAIPFDGRFKAIERDDTGALFVRVEVGNDLHRCFMRDSFVSMRFRQPSFWYASFLSEDAETHIFLRNDEYFRFRAALRLALKRTDLFC